MKKNRKILCLGIGLLAAFAIWTALLYWVDVQPIGPRNSCVGFATVNGFFHDLTGVHMWLYTVTDWLGLVPIAVCLCFGVLGLAQWICRKRIGKVDSDILVLGGMYLVTMAVYVLFEQFVVNYRPILIAGYLEASYPSSTTLLVMCVMPPAFMQCSARMRHGVFRSLMRIGIITFVVFMVLGRLISGVHWLSDIIGGALFSAGLNVIYYAITKQ